LIWPDLGWIFFLMATGVVEKRRRSSLEPCFTDRRESVLEQYLFSDERNTRRP
jgi:hypothetical protein